MPPWSLRNPFNTPGLPNPSIHHRNSVPVHALPLHHPPDLHHLSFRPSTSKALDNRLQALGGKLVVRTWILEGPETGHAVLQPFSQEQRLIDECPQISDVCEMDRGSGTRRFSSFGRPLPGGMASPFELAVYSLYRQLCRVEQMCAMNLVQLEPSLQTGKQLQRAHRACSLQFDQLAELKDGLELTLSARSCTANKVSRPPGGPAIRMRCARRLLLWRRGDMGAIPSGRARTEAGAAEDPLERTAVRVSLGCSILGCSLFRTSSAARGLAVLPHGLFASWLAPV
jgi:hypothetical protein